MQPPGGSSRRFLCVDGATGERLRATQTTVALRTFQAGIDYFFLVFFALHFWVDVADCELPSQKLVVSLLTIFFFLLYNGP